jgi:Ca2+-binding RTX toxin-like protein
MKGRTGRLVRRFSLASLAAAALFTSVNAPTAAAQESLAASCEPPSVFTFGAGEGPVAQNFTSQLTGDLTRAEVSLVKAVGSTEPFIVQITTVDSSGIPTEVVLATATIPAANVGNDENVLAGVVFTSPAAVVAGQQYAILASRPGGSFTAGVRVDSDPPVGESCPGIQTWFNGTAWETRPNNDWMFRVFVTPHGVPSATCKGRPATIIGTAGDNLLVGTNGPDVINALDGNDKVLALDGNDVVCGNDGKDRLLGQDGEDILKGNRGNDTEKGGGDDDRLKGNRGADLLKGKGGEDFLGGGKGNDTCRGGGGDDKQKSC